MQATQTFHPIDCLKKRAIPTTHVLHGALADIHSSHPIIAGFTTSQELRLGGLGPSFEAYCAVIEASIKKALFDLQIGDNILHKKLDLTPLLRSVTMMCATSHKRGGPVARHVANAKALLNRVNLQLAGIAAARHVERMYLPVARRHADERKLAWPELEGLLEVVPLSLAKALSQGRQDVRDASYRLYRATADRSL